MTTTLADQLRRLSVPQAILARRSEKTRASFLFEGQEAAQLDRDEVFSIGLNGFEELLVIDRQGFIEFETNLFAESSKFLERSVESREVNERIDKAVSKFLFRLSPFVLLRSAHKAIEWLVYRFHVHLFNANDLVRCFLPFHGSNVFVRMVQLLDLQNTAKDWVWLEDVKKNGIALAKLAVINLASKDFHFLKFICESVALVMNEYDGNQNEIQMRYRTVITFYTITVVGVVQKCEKNHQNELLTLILPYALKGLRSNVPDVVDGSLEIISQVTAKIHLLSDLLEALVRAVVKVICNKKFSKHQAIMTLVTIFQWQEMMPVNTDCLIYLFKFQSFISQLSKMENEIDVAPIIQSLLLICVSLTVKLAVKNKDVLPAKKSKAKTKKFDNVKDVFDSAVKCLKEIKMLVRTFNLNGDVVRNTIKKILESFGEQIEQKHSVKIKKKLCKIMSILLSLFETKYPDIFDERLEKCLESASKQRRNIVLNVLHKEGKSAGKSYGASVYLNLNHVKKKRRKAAVERLLERIKTGKEKESNFIKDALKERLQDDFYEIPLCILKELKHIHPFIPPNELHQMLIVIADKHNDNELLFQVLNVLCSEELISSMDSSEVTKLVVFLLPFILPTEKAELEPTRLLVSSYLFRNNTLLSGLETINFENESTAFVQMLSNIILRLKMLDTTHRKEFCQFLMDRTEQNSKSLPKTLFVTMSVLSELFTFKEEQNLEIGFLLIQLSRRCLKEAKLLNCSSNTSHLKIINENQIPVRFLVESLEKVFHNVKIPQELKKNPWWSRYYSSFQTLQIDIFNLVTEQVSEVSHRVQQKLFHRLLERYVEIYFKDPDVYLPFLGHLWSGIRQPPTERFVNISLATQAKALAMASIYFQNCNNIEWMKNNNTNIPSLLVPLDCSEQAIRILVLNCFQQISLRKIEEFPYKKLVRQLIKNRAEIEMDFNQVPQIVSKVCDRHPNILSLLLDIIITNDTPNFIKASVLRNLRFANSVNVLPLTCGLVQEILKNDVITESEGIILECILSRLTPDVFVELQTNDLFDVLLLALNSTVKLPHLQITCCRFTLKLITKQLLAALQDNSRQLLYSTLIDLKLLKNDPELDSFLSHLLKKISTNSANVIFEFRKLINLFPQAQQFMRPTKKARLAPEAIVGVKTKESNLETDLWNRENCLLVMLNRKKKPMKNLELLIPILFDLLKRCLELENQSAVEMRKQIILTGIHQCCSLLSVNELSKISANVELIVQCLRASDDKNTHNDALIVLGLLANVFPETVLHNVIAIFTFMGRNMLRQDDFYSFEIMARTTQAVIPAMLASNAAKTNDKESPVLLVLRIFVDAFPHIPTHRRLTVFTQLIDALDPTVFLGTALALLLELHVNQHSVSSTHHGSSVVFASDLCAFYPPLVQMQACVEIVQLIASLPTEKVTTTGLKKKRSRADAIFDVENHTPKQLRHFKFTGISFVTSVLSNQLFVEQVKTVRQSQPKEFEKMCETLLQDVLQFSNRVAQCCETSAVKPTSTFWKTLLHRTYDILDKVNSMLPGSVFVSVVNSLMESRFSVVRRKAMELLNSRLHFHPDVCQDDEIAILVVLIDPLLRVLENDKEELLNQQVALLSLKLLCRLMGSSYISKLKEMLEIVINTFIVKADQNEICGSSLLTIVEICGCLRAHSIGYLNKFMPLVLDIICHVDRLYGNELLLLSIISSINRIVEVLAYFISPFLHIMIRQLCIITVHEEKSSVTNKLNTLKTKLPSLIPARVLLPAITASYNDLISKDRKAVIPLMKLLTETIVTMDTESRSIHFQDLQTFFLSVVEFRTANAEEEMNEITALESSLFEPFLALIMKLSENNFRPLFFKIYSWATQFDAPIDRTITFYHLLDKITEKLKSLFLLFAGHLIQNAANLLDANNTSKKGDSEIKENEAAKSFSLVDFILSTLHKCFLYDKEGFVNRERFETLLNPLVDQIENFETRSEEEFDACISTRLAPTLSQFAEAVGDEAAWKQLNYQILLKTRHSLPKVRLAALTCIEKLFNHLEKDFLSLLPEAMPFLSELMEDESTEVENKCHKLMAQMDALLK